MVILWNLAQNLQLLSFVYMTKKTWKVKNETSKGQFIKLIISGELLPANRPRESSGPLVLGAISYYFRTVIVKDPVHQLQLHIFAWQCSISLVPLCYSNSLPFLATLTNTHMQLYTCTYAYMYNDAVSVGMLCFWLFMINVKICLNKNPFCLTFSRGFFWYILKFVFSYRWQH